MKTRVFLLFVLLFLTLAGTASSMKVSGRTIVHFEPGLEYKGEVCIIPEGINKVQLIPEGSFADRIELEETLVDIEGSYGCVPYTLDLPEETDRPGIIKSGIKVKEAPKTREKGNIVALVEISHQIWVEVPYPGKYLNVGLGAENVEAGENVKFTSNLESKGKDAIESAKGTIEIRNRDGNTVDKVEGISFQNIKPGEKRSSSTYWNSTGNEVGDYSAKLFVEYAGKEAETGTNFKIGSLEIRLSDYTKEVHKSGIVAFKVRVESYWSEQINNVRATVDVRNSNTTLQSFETLSQDIPAWESQTLEGYVDTRELDLEQHDLEITLHYEGRTNEYYGTLNVTEEPEPETESSSFLSGLNTTTYLLISTVILAIIAVILALKVIFRDKN